MRTVVIESPYAAPTAEGVARNVAYAQLAVLDSLGRGEAPYASHLFFTQVHDDDDSEERRLGIHAGLVIGTRMGTCAAYVDLGISSGMETGIARARFQLMPIDLRKIEDFEAKIAARLAARYPSAQQIEMMAHATGNKPDAFRNYYRTSSSNIGDWNDLCVRGYACRGNRDPELGPDPTFHVTSAGLDFLYGRLRKPRKP